eukprot:762534-Hanusia_phi.AAC.2
MGDIITITFNRDTNMAGFSSGILLSQDRVENIFNFTQSLGSYQGIWVSRSVFRITILNTTFSSPPKIGVTTVSIKLSADLRNFPPTAAPSTATAILGGNFGLIVPRILLLTARDPRARDSVYGAGDEIILTFDLPTNRAGRASSVLSRTQVDAMFMFSLPLGRDYQGSFVDDKNFVITVLDVNGSSQPLLGRMTVTCRNNQSNPASLILLSDNSEGACFQESPILQGDFGPSNISFLVQAKAWENKTLLGLDSLYMAGDQIVVTFSEVSWVLGEGS